MCAFHLYKHWNPPPIHIKPCPTLSDLKCSLKTHRLSPAFNSVQSSSYYVCIRSLYYFSYGLLFHSLSPSPLFAQSFVPLSIFRTFKRIGCLKLLVLNILFIAYDRALFICLVLVSPGFYLLDLNLPPFLLPCFVEHFGATVVVFLKCAIYMNKST